MNNFGTVPNDDYNENRGFRGSSRGWGRGRGRGRGRGNRYYEFREDNRDTNTFQTSNAGIRQPRRNDFERMDNRFDNQYTNVAFENPQFRAYDRQPFFRGGRGRGSNQNFRERRGDKQYFPAPRNREYRKPQNSYYNNVDFQRDNQFYEERRGFVGNDDRTYRRQGDQYQRYQQGRMNRNNNENEFTANEYDNGRGRYNDRGGRYPRRRGGQNQPRRGRGRRNDFVGGNKSNYRNTHEVSNKKQSNYGRKGQNRRGREAGDQKNGRQEEKKVPFLEEIVQVQSPQDLKPTDNDGDKKANPVGSQTAQYTNLHYWDAPAMGDLPPLEEKDLT